MKKNIALLTGGYSGEYEISIQSAENIARHLDAGQYCVYTLFITKNEWFYKTEKGEKVSVDKNSFSLSLEDKNVQFDAAFLAIHGSPGEDGKMQGYFEMLGIPYTGCNLVTSALTFNKSYCNKVVADFRLVHVAKSLQLVQQQEYRVEDIVKDLKFPVFVKPAESGSSLGISKVTNEEGLSSAIQKAFKEHPQILIEEFIRGRELTCGVYLNQNNIHTFPITEIKTPNDFFDYEAKYTPGLTDEITPAEVEEQIVELVQNTSKKLYLKLSCKGLVRFDYILEESSKKLYFLEVNTMPGQSSGSIVPRQIRAEGLTPAEVYNTLLADCFASVSQ